jgi:hypothetical protein
MPSSERHLPACLEKSIFTSSEIVFTDKLHVISNYM